MAITLTNRQPEAPDLTAPPSFRLGRDAVSMDTSIFGENPWDAPDEYEMAKRQWRAEAFKQVETMAMEPDKAFKGADFSWAQDPLAEQRKLTVDSFIDANLDDTDPFPQDEFQRHLLRVTLSERFFGGKGAESDDAFFSEIQATGQAGKERQELMGELHNHAVTDAMTGAPTMNQETGTITRGGKSWPELRAELQGKPGYDPAHEAELMAFYYDSRAEAKQKLQTYKAPLDMLFGAMQGDTGPDEFGRIAYETASAVPREKQEEFLEALLLRAQTLPKEEQPAFWANFSKSLRGIAQFRQGALEEYFAASLRSDPAPPGDVREIRSLEERQQDREAQRKDAKDFQLDREFVRRVQEIHDGTYDPVQYLKPEGSFGRFFEEIAYQAVPVTVNSLTMVVPYVGMPAMFAGFKGHSHNKLMGKLTAAGMDTEEAAGVSEAWSIPMAALETALEKLQYGIWSRKMPGFSKWLDTLGDKIANRAARFGMKTVLIGTAETGIEIGQETSNWLIQDLAAALNEDLGALDAQWNAEEGGVFEGFWWEAGVIFGTMLPLSILGASGGLSMESRNAAFRKASPLERSALGITPEASAAIDAATGPSSLASAIDQAWATRDPNSPEAQAAVEQMKQRVEQARRASAMLEGMGYSFPGITVLPDGIFIVRDNLTGEEVGRASSAAELREVVNAHSVAMESMQEDEMLELGAWLGAARVAAKESGIPKDLQLSRRFGMADVEAMGPAAMESYMAEVALQEQAEGGDGSVARVVFGVNLTEIRNGQAELVHRIFKDGNIGTLFHENWHAARDKAKKAGTLTREDDIKFLRSWDTVLKGSTRPVKRADGSTQVPATRLSFIPEGMQDIDIPEKLLDEAIAEVAEVLSFIYPRSHNTSRDAKANQKNRHGLTRKIVSTYLGAVGRLAPEATRKFSAFIRAIRAKMGLAMSRAYHLKKGIAAGTIDPKEIDAYMAKLMGTDAQQDHDDGVRAELNRILNMPDNVADDDIPFSIGRESDGTYPVFQLNPNGPAFSVTSNTGVIYPDGHEIDITQNRAPVQIPDAGGAFWDRLSKDGRHAAVLGEWEAYEGRGMAEDWIKPALTKSGENPTDTSVEGFWNWLRDTLNSQAFEGIDPVDTMDALMDILQLDSYRTERDSGSERLHYAQITPDGTVLAVRDSDGQASFAKLPPASTQGTFGFSIGRAVDARDTEYLAAVEQGDMETVQRMVDEAALKAGYVVGKGHHGTADPITEFNKNERGRTTDSASAKRGFFFAKHKDVAEGYADFARPSELDSLKRKYQQLEKQAQRIGTNDAWKSYYDAYAAYEDAEISYSRDERTPNIVTAYLAIENPLIYDYKGADFRDESYDSIIKQAQKAKNDGVILQNTFDGVGDPGGFRNPMTDIYVVFEPSQIKSADPVTRDEQGNIIPLSQRFNPETPDIRFSIGRSDRPYFSATNVQDLRHDKTAWLKDENPRGKGNRDEANEIVSKYYKTAAYAGIPKDVILVPVPSTTGRNILPDALGVRISKDFGQVLETRRVGTATAAGEAKNKRTFFDKEADPVNFVPNEPVIAELQGKRVFITEDVHNTGESWIAFARMLQENGVDVVGIATLVSTEQRITSPRDMERMSEKMAGLLSKPLDEVLAAVHSLFDGTYKQLFNKAEAEISRANERSNASNARKIFDIASSGRRAGAYSNPLRDRGQSESGVSRPELSQDSFQFSIGRADVAERMQGGALSMVRDPIRRVQAMSRIARDFGELFLSFQRIEALAGRRRSKGQLRQEANAREDMAAEEKIGAVWAKYGEVMADDDLTRLKAQPVFNYLGTPRRDGTVDPLRGRLMSKAQAIKKHPDRFALHRGGEYEGADDISRTVFGGQLMPDQAAQELFDAGLIADPTPDAMWEALAREQRSVDTMKDFLAKAKEEIREARREAKREATEWLQTQGKEQEVNYNPKEEILASLRMLDAILLALPPEIRGKIGGYTQMAKINTDEARLSFLKDKLKKADKELEQFLRESFTAEWLDLLRRAKPDADNPGQRPTGVIDADALDILRAAEAAMWMSFAEGETEADRLDALAEHEETKPEDVDKLRATAQMVRLTSNWSAADAARREQAVMEGTRIYYGGLAALRIKQSRRRERLDTLRLSAKNGIKKLGWRMERREQQFEKHGRSPKSAWAKVKEMSFSFVSFPQLVNVIFGEKSAVAKWMVGREMAAARAMEDGYMAKLSGLEEVFENLSRSKFDGVKLRHRMQTETRNYATDALGRHHEFTDAEAISFLLTWRQEDGRRHMEGRFDDEGKLVSDWGWTEEAAAAIEAGLSAEANAVFAYLANSYGSEYNRINEVFRRIWNVSMPRHKHYAPLTTKPTNENADSRLVDPSSGETVMAGMTPGSLKNRSQTAVTEIEFRDAIQVYLQHARQMEHFIAYGEYSRDALQIVGRVELLNAVEAQGGEAAKRVLLNWLNFFAQGGVKSPTAPGWHDTLKNMAGRLVSVGLVGRVSTLVMQSLQFGAALYRMPVGAYLAGNARLMTGKLDLSVAFENQFTQRRFEEMPPIVRDAVRSLRNASPTRLKYEMAKIGRLISGSDAFFTIQTYALLHDYHKRNAPEGHPDPHKYAHEITEVVIDQIAMPTRSAARSWLEISQQGNPVWRYVFNFASEVRQKAAILVYEMIRRDADVTSHAQSIAKMLAVTWAVQGGMQTVLRSIMRDMRDDDDDEVFDEKHWDPKRMALSTGLGPIGGVPIFGKEIENSVYALAGEHKLSGSILDAAKRSAGTLPKVVKGESTDPLRDIETLLTGAAMGSGNAAAAASIMHVVRDAVNLYDNFKPDGKDED